MVKEIVSTARSLQCNINQSFSVLRSQQALRNIQQNEKDEKNLVYDKTETDDYQELIDVLSNLPNEKQTEEKYSDTDVVIPKRKSEHKIQSYSENETTAIRRKKRVIRIRKLERKFYQ